MILRTHSLAEVLLEKESIVRYLDLMNLSCKIQFTISTMIQTLKTKRYPLIIHKQLFSDLCQIRIYFNQFINKRNNMYQVSILHILGVIPPK